VHDGIAEAVFSRPHTLAPARSHLEAADDPLLIAVALAWHDHQPLTEVEYRR
jgi:hypothetical protein